MVEGSINDKEKEKQMGAHVLKEKKERRSAEERSKKGRRQGKSLSMEIYF